MDILGTLLVALAGLGVAAFGLRFARHGPFIDYHVAIIEAQGGAGEGATRVIVALYRVVGGAFLAMAVITLVLAAGPLRNGDIYAVLSVAAILAIAGIPATLVPMGVERATGQRTPWRGSAGLVAIGLVGVLLIIV